MPDWETQIEIDTDIQNYMNTKRQWAPNSILVIGSVPCGGCLIIAVLHLIFNVTEKRWQCVSISYASVHPA